MNKQILKGLKVRKDRIANKKMTKVTLHYADGTKEVIENKLPFSGRIGVFRGLLIGEIESMIKEVAAASQQIF